MGLYHLGGKKEKKNECNLICFRHLQINVCSKKLFHTDTYDLVTYLSLPHYSKDLQVLFFVLVGCVNNRGSSFSWSRDTVSPLWLREMSTYSSLGTRIFL